MRPYEVMIIFDPTLEDDVIQTEVDKATEVIRANGGTPGRVDRWGKRKLAYEIRKQMEGYYVLLEAAAEPAAMAQLDRALQLADPVMRHKVLRVPDAATRAPRRPAPAAASSAVAPETVPDVAAEEADVTGSNSKGE